MVYLADINIKAPAPSAMPDAGAYISTMDESHQVVVILKVDVGEVGFST